MTLTDDELDNIVRKEWGNGWMLPGEPQRMQIPDKRVERRRSHDH